MLNLDQDILQINGVGKQKEIYFHNLNIFKIKDLVYFFPVRYLDYSSISKIKNAKIGELSLIVKFNNVKEFRTRNHHLITQADAYDDTSKLKVIWFDQPYRKKMIDPEKEYFLSGKLDFKYGSFSIISPIIESADRPNINSARIIPIYHQTKGLKSSEIRKVIFSLLNQDSIDNEILSKQILKEYKLLGINEALKNIHFPKNSEMLQKAKYRIDFENMFILNLSSIILKEENKSLNSYQVKFNLSHTQQFLKALPFVLTPNQKLVIWQIIKDLEKPEPMNRLIEGDVGTGKTVIAACIAYLMVKNDFQVGLMAPTEILATQHYNNIKRLFKILKIDNQIGLLSSSTSKTESTLIYSGIKNGDIKLIIGTHSLIQTDLKFKNLALTIIDEQHRFGVKQRQLLKQKSKFMPHLLSLSATPIPRSLALTLFQELKISKLTDKPIKTDPIKVIVSSYFDYLKQINKIKTHLKKKEQLIIVCRSIDSTINDQYSIAKVFKETARLFNEFKIEIIHGKMKSEQKNKVMDGFINHKFDILISTTVIEVGIDNPKATQMVIYESDKFGLAQLYQLKGRVGRHQLPGTCYLLFDPSSDNPKRLKLLQSAKNGFEVAEMDLKIRGPGSIYGIFQHGKNVELKLSNINNQKLNKITKEAALNFFQSKSMIEYKPLLQKVNEIRKIINLD